MNFNTVDIDIATDYTGFTNTVTFSLAVPVSETDATAIYKAMQDGKWSDTETAIQTAITNSAPDQVQKLATTLINAYTGKTETATEPTQGNTTDNSTDNSTGDNTG